MNARKDNVRKSARESYASYFPRDRTPQRAINFSLCRFFETMRAEKRNDNVL